MQLNSLESFFHTMYMPHGHCYLWQPHLLWSNVLADALIAASYFSIPIALMVFSKKRPEIGQHWLAILFSAFILLCGVTHLIGIFTVWKGAYGIHAVSKIATAIVSMVTAVYLFRLLPEALSVATPAQVQGFRNKLKEYTHETTSLKNQLSQHELTSFALDTLPVSTLIFDSELRIISCNPHFIAELGLTSSEQIQNQPLSQLLTLQDPFYTLEKLQQEIATKSSYSNTLICNIKLHNGQLLPMEISLKKTRFKDDSLIVAVFNNLTKLRTAEHELKESHQQMQRAVNATEDGIWEWNVQTNEVNYSPKLLDMIGHGNEQEAKFEMWLEHIHPKYIDKVNKALDNHFQTKEQYKVEYLGKDKNDNYSWFLAIGNSVFDTEGNPTVMSGALRNIETEKQLRIEIAEKENILNAIYNGTQQAIWLVKAVQDDFVFLEFNQTACERAGVKYRQIIGKPLTMLSDGIFTPENIDNIKQRYSHCQHARTPTEYTESFTFNGKTYWYQTTLYPLIDESDHSIKIVGTAIDITHRKLIESELQKSQHFLEKMIDSTVCGLYLYDLKSQINTRINQRYSDLIGYTLEELQQQDLRNFFHPDEVDAVFEHIQTVIQKPAGHLTPMTYRFKHKAGHWVWCYSFDTVLTVDEQGNPDLMLGTFIDITEQTNLMNELKASNESLERFAFIASHDLQEPLRKIASFSSSLATRLASTIKADPDAEFEFSRLLSATERMRNMIQDLLKLSRLTTRKLSKTPCTLKLLTSEISEQLSLQIEESDALIITNNADTRLTVDYSLMLQVLQNLITNSLKFRHSERPPEITIGCYTDKNKLVISYQDNGIGIKPEYRKQIFEPFQRVFANQYAGSGIGLSLVKKIIELHDGQIECVDSPNEGASFLIHLPMEG
ncbi:PAS domain S-box protein [Pseudoalteromonas phenolica]|uniref:PAS domain S-box protein n=1 Tax=Pseudoalteromonas phenolica TaxID=161398 RepID=UPI00384E4A34